MEEEMKYLSRPKLAFFFASFILLLGIINPLLACEICQETLQYDISKGVSQSIHSGELLELMKANKPLSSIIKPLTLAQQDSAQISPTPIPPKSSKTEDINQTKLLFPTSYVKPGTKPDKKLSIEMTEGKTFLGNGVIYMGFLINGKIPGPTFTVDEGDVIEFTAVNHGSVPHGVSIHAAYTQTSKHLGKIEPGQSKTMLFRASYPGVYLYHCAPGGHAIPMHVLFGQYGMIVVKPKSHQYKMEEVLGKKPDVELYLIQHELYANGKDAIEGKPKYTLFNGKLFRYVSDPVVAKPGDFIRIYFLNVGPNLISTLHIVGIIWDYAYWQGSPLPENTFIGGQTVLAGPSDTWIVDFRAPEDEGDYLLISHALGQTSRGAIGVLKISAEKNRTENILADGPTYTPAEMEAYTKKAIRFISPFQPGPDEIENPWRLPNGQTNAKVEIIGNSYNPKVIEIPVGTTVEWINEDVFTFSQGEFAGIHNVMVFSGPEMFASPMLGHAEKFSHTFTKAGEYSYLCTPHPYMRGLIKVVDRV